MWAERTLDRGARRPMVRVRKMRAVLQAAHTVASTLSARPSTGQQRQRSSEQCDNDEDGLSATHRG
jgi:hypothetical protein